MHNKGNALPSPLWIKIPQMNAYAKYFDKNNNCINLLVNDKEILRNAMKYGMKLKIYLGKNLIMNQCIMINK